jgi:hypothetical protein
MRLQERQFLAVNCKKCTFAQNSPTQKHTEKKKMHNNRRTQANKTKNWSQATSQTEQLAQDRHTKSYKPQQFK